MWLSGKICGGQPCLMAWTCVNCTGGHKVFEKFISIERLPARTKWRQRRDEMKEGYQSSNSLQAGKQADRSIQQQTCYFSRQEQPWRQFRSQWPEVTSPGRWGHVLFGSRRRGSTQFQRVEPMPQFQRAGPPLLRAEGAGPLPQWAQRTKHWAKEDCSQASNSNGICPSSVWTCWGPMIPLFLPVYSFWNRNVYPMPSYHCCCCYCLIL